MAVAADEIYVDKASIVGSIGVLMDGFGFTGLMDKLGVERRLLTAGANKGMLDPFSPADPKADRHAKAMIDQIHQQFITVVKQGRGERLKETPTPSRACSGTARKPSGWAWPTKLGNLDFVAREVVKAEEVDRLHAARQRGRAAGQALRRGRGARAR
jgi:protease-4